MNTLLEKAQQIRCLICDVDGVLTNGLLYLGDDDKELKAFHIQDGMGLKLLMSAGIEVAVITTSRNNVIEHRMRQLGITHYFTGQVDKRNAYAELKTRLGFTNEQFAYAGDDLPDLPIIQQVGLGVAVANAVPQVKEFAAWITAKQGGEGAVREICDLILEAQQKMQIGLEKYLQS